MLQVMDDSAGNYVSLKIVGKITAKDYETLVPYLKESIKVEGPLNILCDMTHFESVALKAAWRDFIFGIQHSGDFNRCALVGANEWVERCLGFIIPFFRLKGKFFKTGQEEEAKDWLKQ